MKGLDAVDDFLQQGCPAFAYQESLPGCLGLTLPEKNRLNRGDDIHTCCQMFIHESLSDSCCFLVGTSCYQHDNAFIHVPLLEFQCPEALEVQGEQIVLLTRLFQIHNAHTPAL